MSSFQDYNTEDIWRRSSTNSLDTNILKMISKLLFLAATNRYKYHVLRSSVPLMIKWKNSEERKKIVLLEENEKTKRKL